jgi:hypothetical protein
MTSQKGPYINNSIFPISPVQVFELGHFWQTKESKTLRHTHQVKIFDPKYVRCFMFGVGSYERHKGFCSLSNQHQISSDRWNGIPLTLSCNPRSSSTTLRICSRNNATVASSSPSDRGCAKPGHSLRGILRTAMKSDEHGSNTTRPVED